MTVIIGLDVGTSRVKAVGFPVRPRHSGRPSDPGNALTAPSVVGERDQIMASPQEGWQVQDPHAVIKAVQGALADCVTQLGDAEVIGIGVTTAMHGLLGLAADLEPLTQVITWADSRASAEARYLRGTPEGEALYRSTGTPIHPMTPLVKLRWFAEHDPDLVRRVRWWIDLKAWVILALTGEMLTDESSASGSGLMEMATRKWSPAALAAAGIVEDQLPTLCSPSTVTGLGQSMASAVGLAKGTPVVVGLGDGPAANIGVGATAAGVAGLSIGTSGAVRATVAEPCLDDAGTLFCYAQTDTTWTVGGAISNGGSVATWAAGALAPDLTDEDGQPSEQAVLELAATAPAGSEGLVVLPYLVAERAPWWNPDLPGAILGLAGRHGRAHLVRAALEGVCLQLRIVLDQLHQVAPVERVNATGGAFVAPLWGEIVAATLRRPVTVIEGVEGSALGAAAVALAALGLAPDVDAARVILVDPGHVGRLLRVDGALTEVYERVRSSIPELISGLAIEGTYRMDQDNQ